MALVHDADERRLAGRRHPADALDVVDDALADRRDQPVPVRAGSGRTRRRTAAAGAAGSARPQPSVVGVAVGEDRHPGPRGVRHVVDAGARRRQVEVDQRERAVRPPDHVVRGRVVVADRPRCPAAAARTSARPRRPAAGSRTARRGTSAASSRPPISASSVTQCGASGYAPHSPVEVGQHLATLLVDAERARRAGEADRLQVAQQRVDGRRPRPGVAAHRVADPHDRAGVAAEKRDLREGHRNEAT